MKFKSTAETLILLLIALFAASVSLHAQDKKVIASAEDAILVAMKSNAELSKAKIDELKAASKVSEVYSENLVPTTNLNMIFTRSFKKQVLSIAGETFEIGSDNSILTQIEITEPIPILGTPVFTGIRIAEHYQNIQRENVRRVEADIKNNVKKAYYSVLLSQSVYDLNIITKQNTEENLKVVEGRFRNGVATEFDLLRAKVKLENILPNLSRSERNVEISRKALAKTMGMDVSENLEVIGVLGFDSSEVIENTSSIVRKITDGNVLVRQLTLNKKINEELVKIDNANYLPKLFLFGNWTNSSNENDGTAINGYRFFNTLNAGIGLTWNLNLFRNSFKKEQSVLEVKKSEEDIRDIKQTLKLTSESAIIALDDARQRIISQRSTVDLAQRGLDLANKSYLAGVLTQIDVLDAELSLYQSRLGYLQAIYDYQVAKSELEKLLEK
ncbi:MAG: TolC family protein [Ignavibacteria bacterium]|jgi:outer membrane protein|nr:TolC family protein [Ignavibacteria bacterium]MBK9227692.1 TolC family protein [Ignavibacteria bacterium]